MEPLILLAVIAIAVTAYRQATKEPEPPPPTPTPKPAAAAQLPTSVGDAFGGLARVTEGIVNDVVTPVSRIVTSPLAPHIYSTIEEIEKDCSRCNYSVDGIHLGMPEADVDKAWGPPFAEKANRVVVWRSFAGDGRDPTRSRRVGLYQGRTVTAEGRSLGNRDGGTVLEIGTRKKRVRETMGHPSYEGEGNLVYEHSWSGTAVELHFKDDVVDRITLKYLHTDYR